MFQYIQMLYWFAQAKPRCNENKAEHGKRIPMEKDKIAHELKILHWRKEAISFTHGTSFPDHGASKSSFFVKDSEYEDIESSNYADDDEVQIPRYTIKKLMGIYTKLKHHTWILIDLAKADVEQAANYYNIISRPSTNWLLIKVTHYNNCRENEMTIIVKSADKESAVVVMGKIDDVKTYGFERTWWRLFQTRVVRTKFDIYLFIKEADRQLANT